MKKICLNCKWFECCDDDGGFLEKGYCMAKPPAVYEYVEDDGTCEKWEACKHREKDIEAGC